MVPLPLLVKKTYGTSDGLAWLGLADDQSYVRLLSRMCENKVILEEAGVR